MHSFITFGKVSKIVALDILSEAVDRYGLKPVGRPVRCGFSCYLITLERAMRHPAVAVIAGESKNVFSAVKSKR